MSAASDEKRKAEYVRKVVRGAGFMPWQTRESVSEAEDAFRQKIERRKDRMLRSRVKVKHPYTVDDEGLKRIHRNIRTADWAKTWYANHKRIADYVVGQPGGYESEMISELYVPRSVLPKFLRRAAVDLRRRGASVIYGTVRLIERMSTRSQNA